MAHHQVDVILCQVVEAGSLGKHTANHLVCDLAAALLIGALRITVEHSGSDHSILIALDGQRVGEL